MKKTQDELLALVDKLTIEDYIKSKIKEALNSNSKWVEMDVENANPDHNYSASIIYKTDCVISYAFTISKDDSVNKSACFFVEKSINKGVELKQKIYTFNEVFDLENDNEDYNVYKEIINNLDCQPLL